MSLDLVAVILIGVITVGVMAWPWKQDDDPMWRGFEDASQPAETTEAET